MIPITRPYLPPLEDYERLLERIWESRMLSNFGAFSRDLERLAANRLGVGTRVVVNGDIGLVIAIAALRLPEGASVVLPSFTFNSTVNAVLWNRLRPIFADVDAATFNIDPGDVDELCARHDAKLILGTHVFGNPCNVEALLDVAARHRCRLLFDAAHAYGATRGGRPVGSFGDGEVFSLSGTKPVTSAEGGLVTSSNVEYLQRIEYLRAYGFQHDYESVVVGLNAKMSELHAALGLLTLERIDAALAVRADLIDLYKDAFSATPDIRFQLVATEDRSSYKDFAVLFPDSGGRERVETALTAAGVQTKRYFRPCHTMRAFARFAERHLVATEDIHSRLLCLPLFEGLAPRDVAEIAATVQHAAA